MALPISVTYTFATATSAIPLSNLDSNFTTVVNAINGIGNGTNALSNVQITGGTITGLSSAIPVASGGTGSANLTLNNVILGNNTNTVKVVAPGTSGNVLTSDGTTWISQAGSASTSIANGNSNVSIASSGGNITTYVAGTLQNKTDTSGNFSFNSGYGSAAVAYGCRAWVNFNGTGTVAIRASGNVTSITDNGTGDYTVNFTTAMSDANYALVANSGTGNASFVANRFPSTAPTTSAARIGVFDDTGAAKDDAWISVQVVR